MDGMENEFHADKQSLYRENYIGFGALISEDEFVVINFVILS